MSVQPKPRPQPDPSRRSSKTAPSLSNKPQSFALEVRAIAGADTLLRMLDPLQKLGLDPVSVRAGRTWDGKSLLAEIVVEGSETSARQLLRIVGACLGVQDVQFMRCVR